MQSIKILIITCLIYQAQAGGSSFDPPTTPAPTTTAIQSCVFCYDVLMNDVSPSPDNCDRRSTTKVSLTVTYTEASGRPPASGACTNPDTGVRTDELGPMFRKFVASPGLFMIFSGSTMQFQDYEKIQS